MTKLKTGLFFGGRSTEHEVSVITAIQAYEHLDKSKYEVIPVYVSKSGRFYTSPKFLDLKNYKDIDSLLLSAKEIILGNKQGFPGLLSFGILPKFIKLDLAFPLFHGSFGEDGCIQGLFEMFKIPYVGFGVLGAALSMDKVASKAFFASLGLNVGKFSSINRSDWVSDQDKCLQEVLKILRFPIFVKPNTGGSSIGINKAKDKDELRFNIEVAAVYADKILLEEAFEGVLEVNCSALGYQEVKASVCEMPVSSGEVLSFDDKYRKGGGRGSKGAGMASLSRIIPAPIPDKLTKEIQDTTIKIFKAFGGCGVARIDYFVDLKKNKVWVNEVNTPPGSLAFYLWQPSGLQYKDLLDQLIQVGLERFEDQKKTQYTFDSGLLSNMASSGGIKG